MNQADLFSTHQKHSTIAAPLAARMAPANFDEFMGQGHIVGPGKLLRRSIETDRLSSLLFYGPPGCGKTALARVIASLTHSHFEETNAVLIGVADIRKIIEQARLRRSADGRKTTLLLDEIHHFNKTQQDALLPDVEKGNITLIGLTTENPYFYVNPALISRSLLFEFKQLDAASLSRIIDRAIADTERGLGKQKVTIDDAARQHLIDGCGGDARRLLNAVEIGALSTRPGPDGVTVFTEAVAEESLQKRALHYDRSGDGHYDHISAFIKSMRGGDADAALYWMSKMLAAGEDPLFVARRVVICASEDVGNADPHALLVAVAALHALEFTGLPEGKIPLSQAVTYVATAPKSNASYVAMGRAEEEAGAHDHEVPLHLRDAHGDGSGKRGHGVGYQYPHDHPGHFVAQVYWPGKKKLYEPSDQGYEAKIAERLSRWRHESGTQEKDKKAAR